MLLGVFIGFVLGLIVAGVIALVITKSPVPVLDRGKTDRPPGSGQNLKDAAKTAQPGDGKPRFDFYRILPGQEEPVTPEQLRQAAAREKAGQAPAAEERNAVYFLQAGAFQSPADADNVKAKLAFLGLESSVEPTTLPEKGVYYRVRLGPYGRIDDINRVRTQLATNGIDASLVKIRDARNP